MYWYRHSGNWSLVSWPEVSYPLRRLFDTKVTLSCKKINQNMHKNKARSNLLCGRVQARINVVLIWASQGFSKTQNDESEETQQYLANRHFYTVLLQTFVRNYIGSSLHYLHFILAAITSLYLPWQFRNYVFFVNETSGQDHSFFFIWNCCVK